MVGVKINKDGDNDDAQRIIAGQLYDEEKLRELSKGCSVVTMEIEHVGVDGLAKLEKEGVNVQPSSRVIGIIQDKFVQKVRNNMERREATLVSSFFFLSFVFVVIFFSDANNDFHIEQT